MLTFKNVRATYKNEERLEKSEEGFEDLLQVK